MQALFPYLLWHWGGLNPDYRYDVSYIPAVIYGGGYLAFLVGAWSARQFARHEAGDHSIPLEELNTWLLLITVGAALQFLFAAKLYGGIPLFGYLKEATDVWEVNSLQADSFMGQLGLLTFTTFFLSTIAMLVVAKSTQASLFSRGLLASSALLCILISSMAGKRQGLLMCTFIVACGIMIRAGDPIRQTLAFFRFSPRLQSSFLLNSVTVCVCMVFLTGYLIVLGSLRRGENIAPTELVNYLEFPLINFEFQAGMIGFGPHHYESAALLAGLLPQKILDSSDTLSLDRSFYPEPTASAGVYGPIHFYSGIGGCMVFALLLGAFCKYAHLKAKGDDLYLMIYAQCSWPLFVSYSFNLFLRIVFVVGPVAAYASFYFLLKHFLKRKPTPVGQFRKPADVRQQAKA